MRVNHYDKDTVVRFAKRLAIAMRIKGYTQAMLADKIDVSKTAVYAYLHYKAIPDFFTLRKICKALGCSADYLLFGKTAVGNEKINSFDEIARAVEKYAN